MGVSPQRTTAFVTDNIHELKNPKYRIPLEKLEQILNFVSNELQMPNIGIETAYKFRLMSIGDMGSVLACCDSLADAANFNTRYSDLAETIGSPALRRRQDGTYIVWAETFTEHEQFRHVTELILGGYIITTNWLCWCFEKSVKSVSFRHSAPRDLERYREICLCPVNFDQGENSLELYPEYVDRPLPSANRAKLAKIKSVLETVLQNTTRQSALEIKSFAAIEHAIKTGTLSAKTVALSLNMSERTYRRHLVAKGIKYRGLVDTVRQTMCRTHMQQGKPFTEIAQILGYNDQSAFTRAFKKWYGTVPSQYEEVKFTI